MKKLSLKPESVQQNHKEWIGVDLDGTLAYYDYWRGKEDIGPPIPKMLMRIKQWIAEGKIVKIFTARATQDENIPYIKAWLKQHDLEGLEITCIKGMACIEFWDDKAIQIISNTGERVDGQY